MKILILEDDIELSLAMKQELLKNDYMVDCCHDGETGLLYALNIEFGYDWEVHPAFRWALYPEARDIFSGIDLPNLV